MELRDVSAIVTGASSGLGEATARHLSAAGARVVLADLNELDGNRLAKEFGGTYVKADVTEEDDVAAVVNVARNLAPLRAIVNCAGIGLAMRTVDRSGAPHDLRAFERVIRVNLIGTFNCVRLGAAAMSEVGVLEDGERGAIVNTASVAGTDGQVGQVAYAASKGALIGMTLPMARDLAAIGVRVNTISPGLIDTPIYGQGDKADNFKHQLGESVLFPKRLGYTKEFATMAIELLSNSYMNGETVRVDGGVRLPPR